LTPACALRSSWRRSGPSSPPGADTIEAGCTTQICEVPIRTLAFLEEGDVAC
jgi:hypothetical protein